MAAPTFSDPLQRVSTKRRVTTLDKLNEKMGAIAAIDIANPHAAKSEPCHVATAMAAINIWYAAATAPIKTFAAALDEKRFSMKD
jgi:hypothetical protein